MKSLYLKVKHLISIFIKRVKQRKIRRALEEYYDENYQDKPPSY